MVRTVMPLDPYVEHFDGYIELMWDDSSLFRDSPVHVMSQPLVRNPSHPSYSGTSVTLVMLKDQRYPIYVGVLPTRPKFHSVLLYHRSFSR